MRPGKASDGHEAKPLEVFFSYSHKDERLRDQLEEHLANLKRQGVIAGWHDRKIGAGREWEGEISEHLDSAHMILLLISPSFLASDYCHDVELQRALERHDRGEARVIPVILRPVDWHRAEFGKLQALPRNAKPVTTWRNRNEALADVARGIREVQPLTLTIIDSPIRRLVRDLERALAVGDLQNSELGPDVVATLHDQRDVELVETFNPRWIIDAIRAADSYFTLIRPSADQRDWQRDFAKAATPVLVGMAWSLECSADAQAAVLRLCDVIAKRLRLKLIWPADADEANNLKNGIYRACRKARNLECDRVLMELQVLKVTGRKKFR